MGPSGSVALSSEDQTAMRLVLAAVGALVAALLELTLVPYIEIDGAYPHPVLVFAVLWTTVVGLEGGLAAAVVGGLALDLLAPRPLGSSVFTLLVSVGGAALLVQPLARLRYLAPVINVFVFSIVNTLLFLVVYGALRSPIPVEDPLMRVLPGAIYDAMIALAIGPVAVALRERRLAAERPDW
jgi:rod shape-determining protein MreD